MDIDDRAFLDLWMSLNAQEVRYILVGDFCHKPSRLQRFTGDVDIYLEDSVENRRRLRIAYKEYCGIDFQSFETIQFIPGWIEFPLKDGTRLDIMTSMVGVDATFEECLQKARIAEIEGIKIPVLHIQHLIDNKKAVGRPKDLLDIINLEKIQEHQQNQSG